VHEEKEEGESASRSKKVASILKKILEDNGHSCEYKYECKH
jgi:hypothetical protein